MTAIDALPPGLIRKLEETAARFDQVQKELTNESVLADHLQVTALSREAGQLETVATLYRQFQDALTQIEELSQLANDPEMGEIAAEELPQQRERAQSLAEQLKGEFVAAEDNRVDSFFFEIRAGTGGEEAALFARDLFEMYRRYAETKHWKFEINDFSESERGGFKEVIVNVKAAGAFRRLQFESGGHRVQRVPATETQGRIHTSAATVAVIPELPDVEIEINMADIEQFGCRGGGPGGQNVNKVETGWFIRHAPSGLQFKMTEHKSQTQNKERAWALLRSTLYETERAKQHAEVSGLRKSQMGSGDRSQRIRTYNFPQNRCTDHRLGGEDSDSKNFNLDKIMLGEMDELLDALLEVDTRQRLDAL